MLSFLLTFRQPLLPLLKRLSSRCRFNARFAMYLLTVTGVPVFSLKGQWLRSPDVKSL